MKVFGVLAVGLGLFTVLASIIPPPGWGATPFMRCVGVLAGLSLMGNGITAVRDSD